VGADFPQANFYFTELNSSTFNKIKKLFIENVLLSAFLYVGLEVGMGYLVQIEILI
jgi:hypothetical protein